jgi:hypothetical protein
VNTIKSYIPVVVVLLIGGLQTFGFIFEFDGLRKAAQLTAASPLPLVFSHYRGLETFSPRFSIKIEPPHAEARVIQITPERYAALDGPYNRRNMYGAAFAFGSVMKYPEEEALVTQILRYGFCNEGPLAQLISATPHDVLTVQILPKGESSMRTLPVRCSL